MFTGSYAAMLALALILALAATSAKGTVAGPTATQANGARVSEGEYTNGWVKSPSPVAGGCGPLLQ